MIVDDYGRGVPRAYLRVALLALLADGPAYGYELLEKVVAAGVRTADAAGLYRALRALEQHGDMVSWWVDSPAGPPRRTYELTLDGRETLANESLELRSTISLLSVFADRLDDAARSSGEPSR